MKLVSWNINGLRAVMKKGLAEFVRKHDADVYMFQEVKMSDPAVAELDMAALFPGYHPYWSIGLRPGYSGLLTLVKESSLPTTKGLHEEDPDDEGRVTTIDLGPYYAINAYFPNASEGLHRLPFKLEFNKHFIKHCAKLIKTKPVVIGGDLNVAHEEIDIARPKENEKNAGFTPQERAWMTKFLVAGYIDTFRLFTKEGGHYTYWSNWASARQRNIGWRIDYFVVSQKLRPKVVSSTILKDVYGSDHCPVQVILK